MQTLNAEQNKCLIKKSRNIFAWQWYDSHSIKYKEWTNGFISRGRNMAVTFSTITRSEWRLNIYSVFLVPFRAVDEKLGLKLWVFCRLKRLEWFHINLLCFTTTVIIMGRKVIHTNNAKWQITTITTPSNNMIAIPEVQNNEHRTYYVGKIPDQCHLIATRPLFIPWKPLPYTPRNFSIVRLWDVSQNTSPWKLYMYYLSLTFLFTSLYSTTYHCATEYEGRDNSDR